MMYVFFNPSPTNSKVGDCVIRSICAVTGDDWDTVYLKLCVEGFILKDIPSSNAVWGEVLRRRGFRKGILPTTCPNCMTIRQFCEEYNKGVYVIGTGNHAVAAIDGDYYDSWDSGNEVVAYFWEM